MPIVPSEIVFRLSVKTGSAGDSTAGTPAGSLGKYVSQTVLSGTTMNNLFDDITGEENAAGDVEYRCLFVLNNDPALTLIGAKIHLENQVANGATVSIAVDDIAASSKGSASAQAAEVADESAAPTGTGAFSEPGSLAAALTLGDIGPGQVKAFWVRRTALAGTAVDDDGVDFIVSGDTAE